MTHLRVLLDVDADAPSRFTVPRIRQHPSYQAGATAGGRSRPRVVKARPSIQAQRLIRETWSSGVFFGVRVEWHLDGAIRIPSEEGGARYFSTWDEFERFMRRDTIWHLLRAGFVLFSVLAILIVWIWL